MAQEQIHEDIKWLEAQLEAKKRELAERGELKEEREMVKEVLRESAAEEKPKTTLLPPPTISDDAIKKTAEEFQEKEHEEIVQELISLVFTKNLSTALKVVRRLKNPHLLDEFHDTLADHYYQNLLEARKISQ